MCSAWLAQGVHLPVHQVHGGYRMVFAKSVHRCIGTYSFILIFEVRNISSPTSDPAISVGIAAGETDIFPTSTLVAFDTLNKTYTFWTDAKSVHGVATDVIRMNVQTAAVATTLEADVKLIGFET